MIKYIILGLLGIAGVMLGHWLAVKNKINKLKEKQKKKEEE